MLGTSPASHRRSALAPAPVASRIKDAAAAASAPEVSQLSSRVGGTGFSHCPAVPGRLCELIWGLVIISKIRAIPEAAVVGRGVKWGCTFSRGSSACSGVSVSADGDTGGRRNPAMPRGRRGGGCCVAGLDGEGVWIGPPLWEIWLRQPAAAWAKQNSRGDLAGAG